MKQRIRTPDDLAWLLEHTRRFHGGQVTDLHVQKRRIFDEGSGREVMAGTILTVVVRYELPCPGSFGLYGITRVARLRMLGVTDFSVFEQEGSDCSEIGVIHAEATGERLRFWFDPEGELYVICDEAELEEVTMPRAGRPVPANITDWTFQAQTGDLPAVSWLLERLDQAGIPCAWRAAKRPACSHPAYQWEGHLMPASKEETARGGLVYVQTYGPLDGRGFGLTIRACDPYEVEAGRLLLVLADIIVRDFEGTCLAGRQPLEQHEWIDTRGVGARWWEIPSGRGEGLSQSR